MKRLMLVCGPNGVGKSTACRALVGRLDGAAFIDSDWCRYIHPFSFSAEEIEVVVSNISTMMINYFRLPSVEYVVFQYGFHGVRRAIFERILDVLREQGIEYGFCPVILTCSVEENIRRMSADQRDEERIKRAVERTRSIYDAYDYPRIDTTELSVDQVAEAMLGILNKA